MKARIFLPVFLLAALAACDEDKPAENPGGQEPAPAAVPAVEPASSDTPVVPAPTPTPAPSDTPAADTGAAKDSVTQP